MATKVLTLRLESEVFRSVCQFQALHGMESPSDAIRALLDLALRDARPIDQAVMRAAWRNGVRNGASWLRDEIDRAVQKALGVTDAEIAARKD